MRRFLAILLFFGIPLLLSAAALTPRVVNMTINPAPDGQRFLFLVDISAGMENLQPEVEATVYDLIHSGIDGYMRAGDTYGIWTFNRQVYAGRFPMQVWDPKKVSPLATIAAAFLSEQSYERSSNLKQAIASLAPVVRAVSNLNVLIVSDGSSSVRGTPFDDAINADYRKRSRERRDAKRPFVTTLIVRDGWFVNNSVTISGGSIPMPQRPLPEMAVTKTNLPPVPPVAPVAPVAKAPSTGKGKVLDYTTVVDAIPNPKAAQTSSVPAEALASLPKEAPTNQSAGLSDGRPVSDQSLQKADPTNSIAAAAAGLAEAPRAKIVQIITKPGPAQTNTPAVVQAPAATASSETGAGATSAVVPPSPTAALTRPIEQNPVPQRDATLTVQAPAETASAARVEAALTPSPIPVSARELNPDPAPVPNPSPALQAVTTPAQNGLSAGFMLTFGAVLLAAALFLLLMTARRFRPVSQGSLITQSMDTQTMQRR